ncbi:glycoside hydrolase/deacetylase [Rhizopus microsporus var. microsporus]|uniref:Glycoside hydrolase/deacetylase n=1 Tax=Rhizopus microsporus var. microsporus TaxID=86635 RepID=A0A1X0R8E4_RHIZD|nr:glycoside hydrolase/deacetylase [Rhizopus microsporus var. microsporus]
MVQIDYLKSCVVTIILLFIVSNALPVNDGPEYSLKKGKSPQHRHRKATTTTTTTRKSTATTGLTSSTTTETSVKVTTTTSTSTITTESKTSARALTSTAITTTTTTTSTAKTTPPSKTWTGIFPTSSPTYYPDFPFGGVAEQVPVPTGPLVRAALNIKPYPKLYTTADTTHPEVKAVIDSIDWNYVPNIPVRSPEGSDNYDYNKDPDCWWSQTECTTPKVSYLPKDVSYCTNPGDFGLTYDDGPLNPTVEDDPWAEPRLYDFLAQQDQKATLFFVGSNVVAFPQAAKRALQAGHTICAHTWSHPQMTAVSNEVVVAELYWNIRAIKEATGVTTRCWRPPFGDVDDRVRAIAHQMGLSTIIWDSDSFDWKLPSSANGYAGTYNDSTVDGFFQGWIDKRKNGQDTKRGHIVLEHETSDMTIKVTERWLPQLKQVFDVKRVHDCAPQLPSPYWES